METTQVYQKKLEVKSGSFVELQNICGEMNANLIEIESLLGVSIENKGNVFYLKGDPKSIEQAIDLLKKLLNFSKSGNYIQPEDLQNMFKIEQPLDKQVVMRFAKGKEVKARSLNQNKYLENIKKHDIVFGIGDAGSGKTFLAVAMGLFMLQQDLVKKLVLVRPVIEAGEQLGFLPGDLSQKIEPYLRPIYDAIEDLVGNEALEKMMQKKIIEIAPLAYMRGRTLSNSYVILDEAQNCTNIQMKMFLTRLGLNSTMVITGDLTQIDLPNSKTCGLKHAVKLLDNINGISFNYFNEKDIVRHKLISKIISAYQDESN